MVSRSAARAAMMVALTSACNTVAAGADATPEGSAGCPFIDASTCEVPVPSYSTDIAPMLDRACNSTCHAPGVGPWPLTDWGNVVDWSAIIQNDIESCAMPPPCPAPCAPDAAESGSLTDSDRAMLLDWIACGAPNN
jgi:hypothetical protein